MLALLVAAFLIGSLLLVHFSAADRPLSRSKPLDVDEGLPYPAAGQSSTVFSLTALFGAYYGIFVLVGPVAAAGLAVGSVVGLAWIRKEVRDRPHLRFEGFVRSILGEGENGRTAGKLISGTQFLYAASELLILREICVTALGLAPHHATVFATGLGVIGYLYILFGGYDAVFRTDVLQFLMVMAMIALVAFQVGGVLETGLAIGGITEARAGYWEVPGTSRPNASSAPVYHFGLGLVMGAGFLIASPDAWKRVHVLTADSDRRRVRFIVLVLAGVLPFFLLTPLVLAARPAIPDGLVNVQQPLAVLLQSKYVTVGAVLGLAASFLSSFDSALLSGVHVGLLSSAPEERSKSDIVAYHWMISGALASTCLVFFALLGPPNQFLLANFLLGPFALVAALLAGSGGRADDLPAGSVLWLSLLGLVTWFIYFTARVDLGRGPTTYQINTVPAGVTLFAVIYSLSLVLRSGAVDN